MKLISPGSRVKFFTVGPVIGHDHNPLKTKFQIIYLSGTVQEDIGNCVIVWTDDSRTFHVPHGYITEIQDPTIPLPISPPTPYPRLPFLLMKLFPPSNSYR